MEPNQTSAVLETKHAAMLTELLDLHRQLKNEVKAAFQEESVEQGEEYLEIGCKTTLISWPDLGVMLACYGFRVHHTDLQSYFLERFGHQEISHHTLFQTLTKWQQVALNKQNRAIKARNVAMLFLRTMEFDKKRQLLLGILKRQYAFDPTSTSAVEELGHLLPNSMPLTDALQILVDAEQTPALVVQPPSTVTSRKSSEGMLGIHSNTLSIRLEKESNVQSDIRDLQQEAKKSSQHIIGIHARSEQVAIQHVRMRTNRILELISSLGKAR